MRCEELTELILLLAYDELEAADQARVQEHLAGCPACRAELSALRETQQLLDLAPVRQMQIDLAAVRLRIANRERRSRALWRWSMGITGLAASLLAIAAVRLLHVEIAPGRVVVAWQQPAPAPAGQGGGAADVKYAVTERDAGNDAGSAASSPRRFGTRGGAVESALLDPRSEAFAFNSVRAGRIPGVSWEALRYAQPIAESAGPANRPINYGDLRRELLDEETVATPPRTPRGA